MAVPPGGIAYAIQWVAEIAENARINLSVKQRFLQRARNSVIALARRSETLECGMGSLLTGKPLF
jgi:hypothetical protein